MLMSALDELSALLGGAGRVIIIAEYEVNLKSLRGKNTLFLLKMAEGSLAAGGRGGGFGERRVVEVFEFRYQDGVCEKLFESSDEAMVGGFEIPYYVTRLPLTLRDGEETMGYGAIDPELVAAYSQRLK